MTFQTYLKVITSHNFNNCHPKEVRWLLSEMLITAWSLVCFCLASSFHLNNSGEGITGNFNRKVCTVSTISAIYLAFLHQVWGYCWKQVAYCFLKFLYRFTTPLLTVLLLVVVVVIILQCVVGHPLNLVVSKDSTRTSCSHEDLRVFMVWTYKGQEIFLTSTVSKPSKKHILYNPKSIIIL